MLARLINSTLAAAVVIALGAPAQAQVLDLSAVLDGAQANAGAGSGSPGTGSAAFVLNTATGRLDWNISWSGLNGSPTAMHFHGPALPNQNGGIQVSASAAGPPAVGTAFINLAQQADLIAGLWYVNLHTNVLPAGEIRGQIGVAVTGPTTYCTAGISANGCQATLSTVGSPSATAVSGFTLTASTVEGNKDGVFFQGSNGRQANTWGNGTSFQCVIPPVQRLGLRVGNGTTGVCDGSISQDLNAVWSAQPAKNPGAGTVVQAQLWYRDPFNTSNQTTSLSEAIEFTVGP